MGASIDQRIVSMKFDNAQFESGAKESLQTLDKLRDGLKFEEASKGLNNLSVSPLIEGINGLKEGFNALDVVAITAISNITTALMNKLGGALKSTIGQIYSGGLKRATNLEQARFAMQGLLYDTEAVGDAAWRYGFTIEDVMGNGGPVQNAVKDTAYGLDEAAKAASNFIASGVTDLGDLETVLKSISGTAAQTGSSYEDIAHIYTRIAGNNRLYAIDLQSFASRGVNAAAAIRDYLNSLDSTVNYTEADVRKLVSDGAIGLDMFSKAMYKAFGPNAFRANETYAGSLSNLKASLSRIGEALETPKLQNMTRIFNELRETADALKPAITPILNLLVDFSTKTTDIFISKIQKVKDALVDINTKTGNSDLESYVSPFERIAKTIYNVVDGFKNIGATIKVIIGPLTSSFKQLVSSIFPITPTLQSASEKFLAFTERLRDSASSIADAITEFKDSNKFFKLLESGIRAITSVINGFIKAAGSFISSITKSFGPVFISIIGNVLNRLEPLAEKLTTFFNTISSFVNERLDFSKIGETITTTFDAIYNSISPLSDNLSVVKDKIVEFFKMIRDMVQQVLPDLTLENVFGWILDFKIGNILKTFTGITNPIGTAINALIEIFQGVKIEEVMSTALEGPIKLAGRLNSVSPIVERARVSFVRFKDGMIEVAKGIGDSEEKFSILDKIKSFLEKLDNTLRKVGSKIAEYFTAIAKAIGKFFSELSLSKVSAGILTVGTGGILYEIFQFLRNIRKVTNIPAELTKLVTDLAKAIEDSFSALNDTLASIQKSKMLESVKTFAISILILAAAVKILSTIPDPGTAVGYLGAIMLELMTTFTIMSKLLESNSMFVMDKTGIYKKTATMTGNLVAFGVAVIALAAAMKILSTMNTDQLKAGALALLAVTGIIALYAAAMAAINKWLGGDISNNIGMVAMGASMLIMAKAIEKLGQIDPGVLEQGIETIKELLLAIGLFNLLGQVTSMGLNNGVGLILMASSLLIFAGAIQLLGRIDPTTLQQGFSIITGLLLVIGIYMYALQEAKPLQTAAALLVLAAALVLLAGAIVVIGNLPMTLNPGPIIAMLAGLVLMAATLALLGNRASIKSAAAMLVLSAAMVVFAGALVVLSLIPFAQLVANLLAITAGLVILGGLSTLITLAGKALMVVSAAFAVFGASLLAIALAITLLTPILGVFVMSLLGSLTILTEGIIEMKEQLAAGLAAMFEIILIAVKEGASLLKELFVTVITILLEGLTELIEPIKEFLITFFTALIDVVSELVTHLVVTILTTIRDHIEEIVTAAIEIIAGFINGIANGLPDIIQAGVNLILAFIEGISAAILDNAERIGEAGWSLMKALVLGIALGAKGFFKEPIKLIAELGSGMIKRFKDFINNNEAMKRAVEFVKGLISGIGSKIGALGDQVKELGRKALNSIREIFSLEKLREIGQNFVQRIADGITKFAETAVQAAKNIGNRILDGIKGIFGIHSPSTVMADIGGNIVEGLNNGLSSNDKPVKTVESLGQRLLNKFTSLFSKKDAEATGSSYVSGINAGMGSVSTNGVVAGIISNLKTQFNKRSEFEAIGKNLMDGMTVGIDHGRPSVERAAGMTASSVVGRVRSVTKVHSPSRVFIEIGEYLMEGLAIGLSETSKVDKQIDSLRGTLTDSLTTKLLNLEDIDPVIRPVLDLSDVQNGMSSINGMFGSSSRLLGSINSNVSSKNEVSIMDSINRLAESINSRFGDELSANDIYNAIREGASHATFNVLLDGHRITSTVNDNNSDALSSYLNFIGG